MSQDFPARSGVHVLGRDGNIETVPESVRIDTIDMLHQKLIAKGEQREYMLWVNTSKAQSTDDAIMMAAHGTRMAQSPYIKLEIRNDNLMTKTDEIVRCVYELIQLNAKLRIIPLIGPDLGALEILQNLPQVIGVRIEIAQPGSGRGMGEADLAKLRELEQASTVPLIAECGIGEPWQAAVLAAMGYRLLVNHAITNDENPTELLNRFLKSAREQWLARALFDGHFRRAQDSDTNVTLSIPDIATYFVA